MRTLLLTAAALGGLTALTTLPAQAATSAPAIHVTPSQPLVTHVDYYWNRHHWHHRRWEHHRWHYWD